MSYFPALYVIDPLKLRGEKSDRWGANGAVKSVEREEKNKE